MAVQISFVGDGRMAMNAGRQGDLVFVCIYDADGPHDLDERLPHPFESMGELVDRSRVILNFTNARSIDNLVRTLEDAKAMLEDLEAFKSENRCDVLDGDA